MEIYLYSLRGEGKMLADFFCEKCEHNPLIVDVEHSNEFAARCICGQCGQVKMIPASDFNEDYPIAIEIWKE